MFLERTSRKPNRNACLSILASLGVSALVGCHVKHGNTTTASAGSPDAALGSFLQGPLPGSRGGPTVKGIWLAEDVRGHLAHEVVEKALQHGFNTLLPNIRYTSADSITHLARVAAEKGLDVQLWLEEGIKFVGGDGANQDLFMPCNDGGAEHGVVKEYLDLRKPEARRFFVEKAVEFASIPGVSALQYDDHVGYFLSKLPCSRGIEGTLKNSLNLLMQETARAVRQKNPNLRLEFSHHNADWAQSNFAVDWRNWLRSGHIDGMFTQAYVSGSVGTEIQKAKATGVKGLGLQNILGSDQSGATLLRNTQATIQAGLGVIYFKWPKLNETERTRLRQLLGGPSAPPVSSTAILSQAIAEPTEAEANINPNMCLASDVSARRTRYARYCTTPERDLEASFDACERTTCREVGGGMACTERSTWNRRFFCDTVAPKILSQKP